MMPWRKWFGLLAPKRALRLPGPADDLPPSLGEEGRVYAIGDIHGRLDLLTRLVTDEGTEFDRLPPGYDGPIYAEICPRSFSVLVRPGMRLNQIRFRHGPATLSDPELKALHSAEPLVSGTAVIGLDTPSFR